MSYALDAGPMLAFLIGEPGAEFVGDILNEPDVAIRRFRSDQPFDERRISSEPGGFSHGHTGDTHR